MVDLVPLFGSLSTVIYPPLCLMMPYTVDNPNPVPLPCSLVVKNGSKIRASVSASIPQPLSAPSERHRSLGAVPPAWRSPSLQCVHFWSSTPIGRLAAWHRG